MEAGGSHPVPRLRFLTRGVVAVLALVCWAIVPATADANVIGTVESTVATVATVPQPVQKTAENVAKGVEPAVAAVKDPAAAAKDPVVPVPAPTVSPVAGADAPALPAAAPKPSQSSSPQQARASVARAAGSSHVERLSAGRADRRRDGSHGATELPAVEPRSAFQATARQATPAAVASDGVATPARPAPQPEPASGFMAGATASGASTIFLFGGGLALLIAALLLAGPGLLRRLTMPPAVCRPAAFVVVLERPG
jgi:hypothetical protein